MPKWPLASKRMDDEMVDNVENSTDSPLVEPVPDDEAQTMEGDWQSSMLLSWILASVGDRISHAVMSAVRGTMLI